jgi:activating signal cointegrator 1
MSPVSSSPSSSFLPLFDTIMPPPEPEKYFGFSLTQPWASLFVAGLKRYETRGWGINIKKRLIIQAAAGFPQAAKDLCSDPVFAEALESLGFFSWKDLPTGALVGSVSIIKTYSTTELAPKLDDRELAFGNYDAGRRAWEAIDPLVYPVPIPCKGKQSIWKMPVELYPLVGEQEEKKTARRISI